MHSLEEKDLCLQNLQDLEKYIFRVFRSHALQIESLQHQNTRLATEERNQTEWPELAAVRLDLFWAETAPFKSKSMQVQQMERS